MALIIDSISKRFGDVQALDNVSLEIEPGEVFGFLGANGAGKTTAMRIVLDILRPDSGTIAWNGRLNTEVSRDIWGYLPEERMSSSSWSSSPSSTA
jgi:ABC-2 type transport system ATP-binding protein